MNETSESFVTRILVEIEKWKGLVQLAVFPEYCWGLTPADLVLEQVEIISKNIPNDLILVIGSSGFELNRKITNNAIIVKKNKEVQFVPKTHTLLGEQKRSNVVSGVNPGVIKISGLNIGVLICADLWDADLVKKLVKNQNADILAIPAFTTVPRGYSLYSRRQWLSLSLTRSREFTIPIIIADHGENGIDYDVGKATNIADPSKKDPKMSKTMDFLEFPVGDSVIHTLNFKLIKQYRDYRISTGLFNDSSSK